MEQKVAVVTGGTRGLGSAMALSLATAGWKVYATYATPRYTTDPDFINNDISYVKCDVRNENEIQNLKAIIAKKHGYIDALINNAGVNHRETMWDISEESWDTVLDTNLKYQFFFTRSLWSLVLSSRLRRIVFMSSAAGQYHGPKTLHYAVSKAGLISMMKVMARYGAEDEIHVNAIAPGLIETEQTKDEFASGAADNIIQRTTLLQRQGYPADVISALQFLLDENQKYMTGQVISVSGGAVL